MLFNKNIVVLLSVFFLLRPGASDLVRNASLRIRRQNNDKKKILYTNLFYVREASTM